MNILLHSFTFQPNVGGVENVSRALAELWTQLGHRVTVVTETSVVQETPTAYKLVRNPTAATAQQLIQTHDIIHANGASMRYFWPGRQAGKPFTWTHPAYQTASVDGFGWMNDKPAPLTPLASVLHYARLSGPVDTVRGAARLACRRIVAYQASANVAVSEHQARCLSLPRQHVIYNPIDPKLFPVETMDVALEELAQAGRTVAYLGRLISEKGVSDLLKAFAAIRKAGTSPPNELKIIGDGPQRQVLETLARNLGIAERVVWTGQKTGAQLREEIRRCGLFVLPSVWQEPMGIVAVELMAAGKPIIVSQTGGLSECGGQACLTFPNGDVDALASALAGVFSNQEQQRQMIAKGLIRARFFDPLYAAKQYIALFDQVSGQSST